MICHLGFCLLIVGRRVLFVYVVLSLGFLFIDSGFCCFRDFVKFLVSTGDCEMGFVNMI